MKQLQQTTKFEKDLARMKRRGADVHILQQKACDNVTTVNNYIGLLPCAAMNGMAFPSGGVALGAGGLTISVSDLNGMIAQSADTAGGDSTDLTANPSLAAGITGDAPIKAVN